MDIYFDPPKTRLVINDELVSLPILKPSEFEYSLKLSLSGDSECYDCVEIKFCLLNTHVNIDIARSCKLKVNNKIEIFSTFYDYSTSDACISNQYEVFEQQLKDGFACIPFHFRCFDLGAVKSNVITIPL